MFVFRCIVSGLFGLGGIAFAINGEFDTGMLLWFIAAAVLPYDAVKNIFTIFALILGFIGVYRLFYFDYYKAVMGIGTALIIVIKKIRLDKEDKRLRRLFRSGYSGYSGYSGGSASHSTPSYDYDADERERRRRDDEFEEERRRRNEELEEERLRRQEAYEAESRRQEAENMSRRKYGCDAETASQWDKDIRGSL